jgi:Subtilase family
MFAPVLALAVATSALAGLQPQTHSDAAGRLQLDVHFDCALAPPLAALAAAGLSATSTVKSGTLCVVEGWAAPAALPRLAAVAGITHLAAPSYVLPIRPRALRPANHGQVRAPVEKQATGSIDGNAISIMRAGQFAAQTGVTGAGVTVGVQSYGVASLSVIQARGELPASITVLQPAGNPTSVQADEGTVLLEEIHAVAPGANLLYCGPSTFVDYVSCLSQLISAGASIVLDDTSYSSDSLMSQDNDETSAVSNLLSQNPGTMMLSAAGNNDGTYWEGNYAPVSAATTTLPALSCPAGSATADAYVATFGTGSSQTLTVTGYATFPLLLAWADPPTQITSHFDVFWFAPGALTPTGCFSSVGATTDQVSQSVTLPPGAYTLVVASPDASTAGKFLKLWAGGDGLTMLSVSTSGGLVSPQAMAPGVLMVGAVNGSDGVGDAIEPFSSSGPLTVVYPASAQLQAPNLVAPDGIMVDAAGTYFESELFPDGNFYGTSAAVPNAAAVAALLRSAFPTLSVSQITTAVQSGATVLGAAAPNDVFGYGRVDALGALGTVPAPTMTALADATSSGSASSATQPFTVSGTGALHFAVSSSNTALVPNSIVTAGTPGVTVSAGCGTSTLSCTLLVTPVLGQSGTATLTVSTLDGANRGAFAPLLFTATDPAPAPTGSGGTGSSAGSGSSTSTASTASTGSGGGGALQGWALLWLALALWSKVQGELQHAREGLKRMHLDAINSFGRFTGKSRGVVVRR